MIFYKILYEDYCIINLYRGHNGISDLNDLNNDPIDSKVDLETQLEEVIRKSPELTYKALGELLAVSAATIKCTMAKCSKKARLSVRVLIEKENGY